MSWLVLYIGCIECGAANENPVIGVYPTEREARRAALAVVGEQRGYWARYHDADAPHWVSSWRKSEHGYDASDAQLRVLALPEEFQFGPNLSDELGGF